MQQPMPNASLAFPGWQWATRIFLMKRFVSVQHCCLQVCEELSLLRGELTITLTSEIAF